MANKFLEPYAGAVLGKIIILVLIILFIQRRPRGLFALKGRAVEHENVPLARRPSSALRAPSPARGEGTTHRHHGSVAFSLDGRRWRSRVSGGAANAERVDDHPAHLSRPRPQGGLAGLALLLLALAVPFSNLVLPATSPLHLPNYVGAAARQIPDLRHARARARPGLGLLRHPLARARAPSSRSAATPWACT